MTVIPTVIGVLGTTSKNTKAWYERLSAPDVFGSGQLSANLAKVLCLCGIAAETWLRIPRKRTGEDHTIIINIIFIKN